MMRRELEEYSEIEDRFKAIIREIDSKVAGGMLIDDGDYVLVAQVVNQLMRGDIFAIHRIEDLIREARK